MACVSCGILLGMADAQRKKPHTLAMSAELMQMLGVSKSRVVALRKDPDWPEPVDTLKVGEVFAIADIQAWAAKRGRTLHPLDD
jgi:predicted DNA-binding transcriptional regulator AlpA